MNAFAKTNFRNIKKRFGILSDDRRRHMYLLGKTGMGKSTLLENMAINDIQNGGGVCILDPHGSFAETALKAVPKEKINSTVYFNPSDHDYVTGFNILENANDDNRGLIVDNIIGTFKKIWGDGVGVRMEHYLRIAIASLTYCPGSTLLGCAGPQKLDNVLSSESLT